MSNLNKALELAGVQLFSVFPVQPGTKIPYPGTNGSKDATNDQFAIEAMWAKHPEAIPAVATGASRIMVIDIDTKKGKDGFAALAAKGMSLPATFNYETPSGGKHYVYFLKNSKSYKQQTNYDGLEGVDRQSGESYVVWHGEVPWDAEMVAPPVWAVTRGLDAAASVEAYAGSLSEWTTRLRPKATNDYAVHAFLHDLTNVRHIGNGELRDFLWRIACDVQAGHPSTLDAFGALRLKYDSTSNEPESKRDAEFERLLRGAIGGAQARDAAGELVHFLEGAYTPPEPVEAVEPPSEDLQVLTWSDLRKIPAPVWMVDSLLRESSLAILAGAGGLGKTYLALYLACAVATGSDALGLKTGEPAKVLYVGAEGIESFNTRLEAIQSYYGLPRDLMEQNLRFIEEGVNLADEDANNRLATVVKNNGFRLIVLDTFSQLVPMKSENDAAEVAGVMREAKRLRTLSPKSCILFLHHAAKDSGRYRGSSALRDNVDTLISAWGKSKGFAISTDSEQSGKQRSGAPFTLNGLEIVSHGDDSVVALTGAKTVTADESNWKLIRDLLCDGTARTRAEIASETALSEEVTKKIVQRAKDALTVAHKVGRTEYLTLTPLPTQTPEPELWGAL